MKLVKQKLTAATVVGGGALLAGRSLFFERSTIFVREEDRERIMEKLKEVKKKDVCEKNGMEWDGKKGRCTIPKKINRPITTGTVLLEKWDGKSSEQTKMDGCLKKDDSFWIKKSGCYTTNITVR